MPDQDENWRRACHWRAFNSALEVTGSLIRVFAHAIKSERR